MERTQPQPHVVIVGGGIAGLAAAFYLRDEPVRVTVLEGSPRPGGKLSVSEVGGVAVDEGAEALLVTRPEGTALIAEAGLADQRTAPGPTSSAIWTLGALRPLPRRQFMGVPSDLAELARSGVLSGDGVARARAGPRAAAHRTGRRRAGGPLRRRAPRRGGRGPAGRPAAGRGLRGTFGGAVVRRHAARAVGRVPPAPVPGRGGGLPAAAPARRGIPGGRTGDARGRLGVHQP